MNLMHNGLCIAMLCPLWYGAGTFKITLEPVARAH
ncbi:hypothetical protein FOXYSP1_05774 [Fusarium oxysporum f. sp. phaseoli]